MVSQHACSLVCVCAVCMRINLSGPMNGMWRRKAKPAADWQRCQTKNRRTSVSVGRLGPGAFDALEVSVENCQLSSLPHLPTDVVCRAPGIESGCVARGGGGGVGGSTPMHSCPLVQPRRLRNLPSTKGQILFPWQTSAGCWMRVRPLWGMAAPMGTGVVVGSRPGGQTGTVERGRGERVQVGTGIRCRCVQRCS